MWPGPYGNWGSRKYLMASLDQSLKRMGLDYVDLFYTHRYDPDTLLEETLQALVDIVRQGKALYVGISRYPASATEKAYRYLAERDVHCLIYQGRYNLFDRAPEEQGILDQAHHHGVGFIGFSPLAQGLLTSRYLQGVPEDSRMAQGRFLKRETLTEAVAAKNQGAERGGHGTRTDIGRNGAGMGAGERKGDVRHRRGQLGGTVGRQPEGTAQARLHPAGTGAHRNDMPLAGRRKIEGKEAGRAIRRAGER